MFEETYMPPQITVERNADEEIRIIIEGCAGTRLYADFAERVEKPIMEREWKTAELDLRGVSYLDTSVLGKVVALHWACKEKGLALYVFFNDDDLQIIRVCNIDRILNLEKPKDDSRSCAG